MSLPTRRVFLRLVDVELRFRVRSIATQNFASQVAKVAPRALRNIAAAPVSYDGSGVSGRGSM